MKHSLPAAAAVLALALSAPSAQAATTCSWAGTAANPTGTFSVSPGVTHVPATRPLDFVASGRLAGGRRCRGTVTFDGDIAAGGTCEFSTFEGRVYGLSGVYRFFGSGGLDVPSQLFDRHGNQVGEENAEIMTPNNLMHASDCMSPQGFTGGFADMFSSVIVLF